MLTILASAIISCMSPHVTDGDTIVCAGQRVRIFGIDAPEISHPHYGKYETQPGGDAATRAMVMLTTSQSVQCSPRGYDRYRRTVAVCSAGEVRDVGEWMIRARYACEWRHYSHGQYSSLNYPCVGPRYDRGPR